MCYLGLGQLLRFITSSRFDPQLDIRTLLPRSDQWTNRRDQRRENRHDGKFSSETNE